MDQPSVPGEEKPFVYSARHLRPAAIAVFVLIALAGFLAGNASPKLLNFGNQANNVPLPPVPAPLPANAVMAPIETNSSAVKSLYIVYVLSGVIDSIAPAEQNKTSGYQLQILSPTGPLVDQKFFVSDKANIVQLDKAGKETKYQLSNLKKGNSIQISYQINIKKNSEGQVTKVAVLP